MRGEPLPGARNGCLDAGKGLHGKGGMAGISLIIPTYNRDDLLVRTLECALRQDAPEYEILVIDQSRAHTPETLRFLEAHRDRIQWIRREEPSLTAARNEGLRRARGEIIVFVDDDTSFEPGFLTAHAAAHEAGADLVQGRVIEAGSRPARRPVWLTRGLRFKGSDHYDRDGKTNNVTGCNFSITRKVVGTVGEFDQRFRGIALREDSDYARRAWRAGFRFAFSARAALIHHRSAVGGVATGVAHAFFEESYYYCEFLFCKKHFPRWVQALYRIRLHLRGWRAVRRLIRRAEAQADEALLVKDPSSRTPPGSRPHDQGARTTF